MEYSLIIPHFNDSERLDRLLRTVPIERSDVEVIVVDDCSPNQKALGDVRAAWPRVHWLSTPENAGAGVARNVGLKAAKGQWLVFADSDDEFLPRAFKVFDETLIDDDELVYFLAESLQEENFSPSIRAERMNELVSEYIKSKNTKALRELRLQHAVPWAKVYSRRAVESLKISFDTVRRGNDVAFNVLASIQFSRIRAVAIPVYRVYRRADSLTAESSSNDLLERLKVIGKINDRLRDLGVKERMHAASYIARSIQYGPKTLIEVFKIMLHYKMVWPTLLRLTPREISQFMKRWKRHSIENESIR